MGTSLSYLGPKIWNLFPNEIKSSTNVKKFKTWKIVIFEISAVAQHLIILVNNVHNAISWMFSANLYQSQNYCYC